MILDGHETGWSIYYLTPRTCVVIGQAGVLNAASDGTHEPKSSADQRTMINSASFIYLFFFTFKLLMSFFLVCIPIYYSLCLLIRVTRAASVGSLTCRAVVNTDLRGIACVVSARGSRRLLIIASLRAFSSSRTTTGERIAFVAALRFPTNVSSQGLRNSRFW